MRILISVLAALLLWVFVVNEVDWAELCRGGQDNPAFHSAECKDIETVRLFLSLPLAVLLAGLAWHGLRRR